MAIAWASGTALAQRGRRAAPPPADGKDIPNFTLVQTAGCLVEDAPRGWRLIQGTELVATKDEPAPAADLKAAASAQPGTLTFRLVSVLPFKPETLRNGRVLLKGIVNRYPGEDVLLNVTGLQAVSAAGCGG